MKVWPADHANLRPTSEFFVNERIDLLVREAETFRNDYRSKEHHIIFHALKKPIPFVPYSAAQAANSYRDREDEMDTQRYCGLILAALILSCGVASTIIISRQNRQTQ